MKEPADKVIVAWFDDDGFPVVVAARDNAAAGQAEEQVGRHWFHAGTANEGALSWEELNAAADGWTGPVRLYRTDRRQNEPGA